MNAHTKQQQDKVFETDFIDSQKSDPPFVHLLALSHIGSKTCEAVYCNTSASNSESDVFVSLRIFLISFDFESIYFIVHNFFLWGFLRAGKFDTSVSCFCTYTVVMQKVNIEIF